MSINRVIISGNLTRDPDLRTTQSGMEVLGLSVAVNDRRKNPTTNEWEDYPNFVDCVMFGSRAGAVAKHLSKGSKVAIEGKLRWSQWERDGIRRSKLEVFVDEIEFMSTRSDNAQPAMPLQEPPARQTTPSAPQIAPATYPAIDAPISIYDDDIPF